MVHFVRSIIESVSHGHVNLIDQTIRIEWSVNFPPVRIWRRAERRSASSSSREGTRSISNNSSRREEYRLESPGGIQRIGSPEFVIPDVQKVENLTAP
jgi:hypothetical protein